MRPGRFFWKLFFGNAALLVIALGISVRLTIAEFDRFHAEELTPYLNNHAETIRALVRDRFDTAHRVELDAIAKQIGSTNPEGVRVTLIAADGTVLGDSQADPAQMESHAGRPEIREALVAGKGESTRWSNTVSRTLKYVAVRIGSAEQPLGVVRVAMTVRTLAEQTRSMQTLLGPIGIIGLLASMGLAVGLAILWSGRIRRITSAAQSLSRGDLNRPIDVSGSDEVALLAKSLDRMRHRILNQLETIDRQRRTLESLIGQLTEGVVVADGTGRITLVNPAAARFLNFGGHFPSGFADDPTFTIEKCVPQHALQTMLLANRPRATARRAVPPEPSSITETRLDVPSPQGPLSLLARACDITLPELISPARPRHATHATGVGRLLVLTDITELTRAIRMRSDFVANASHELRTPLSAIRVAVETLMKMNLAEETAAATRFLGVVARHSFHLEAMVSDLLDLARVESPSARLESATLHLQRVFDELRARWEEALGEKQLRWRAEVAPDCPTVHANAHLLKLVLDNLVDNAIKFTEAGGEVAVNGRRIGDRGVIEVSDTGCGIDPVDQERVFERFYQVAPERSGTGSPAAEKRGTGLGLSIVRHAVSALGGTIKLESEVGVGTRVVVSLPLPRPRASS
ncbi:MAG: ATP-binding protein [Planctomycetota bacterium]